MQTIESLITAADREKRNSHRAVTIWLTGLSGAGKTTISRIIELHLFKDGYNVCRLDGDALRRGLNCNLGFSPEDRSENIRRTAEVARLMNDSGCIVLCALISPFASDRQVAANIIGKDRFFEVFVNAPLEVCETRDPRGLYKSARAGNIQMFTGISSPYEVPTAPDLILDTAKLSIEESVESLLKFQHKLGLKINEG